MVTDTHIRWVKMVHGWSSLEVSLSSDYLLNRFGYAWTETHFFTLSGKFGFGKISDNGTTIKAFTVIS